MSKARGLADLGNTYSDGSLSNRNRIINGGFVVNQKSVTGSVVLSAGEYGHDMWKAGASGCSYTFATSENVTTITISAGSLIQVVEGVDLQSGTHTLSWAGTIQMKIDGGSAGGSGMTGTATGGTNLEVETSGTGTVTAVQFEAGDTTTPFEYRLYTQELMLCQRHFWRQTALTANGSYYRFCVGMYSEPTVATGVVPLPVEMRDIPEVSCPTGGLAVWDGVSVRTGTFTVSTDGTNTQSATIIVESISGGTQFRPVHILASGGTGIYIDYDARL